MADLKDSIATEDDSTVWRQGKGIMVRCDCYAHDHFIEVTLDPDDGEIYFAVVFGPEYSWRERLTSVIHALRHRTGYDAERRPEYEQRMSNITNETFDAVSELRECAKAMREMTDYEGAPLLMDMAADEIRRLQAVRDRLYGFVDWACNGPDTATAAQIREQAGRTLDSLGPYRGHSISEAERVKNETERIKDERAFVSQAARPGCSK